MCRCACAAPPGSRSAHFFAQGITLEVFGDANDYVGKGLSGGRIIVRPTVSSPLVSQRQQHRRKHRPLWRDRRHLVAAGQAGERFAVRSSGAKVVIETAAPMAANI